MDVETNLARYVQRAQLGPGGRHRRVRRLVEALPADARGPSLERQHAAIRRRLLLELRSEASDVVDLASRETGRPVPAFQLAFAHGAANAHLLAAADEDGVVSVIDTRAGGCRQLPTKWLAHRNAIFDVVWTYDDQRVVTAAGDLQLRGWDAETRRAVFSLEGHRMSVKCVRQAPDRPDVFASGARDGHVLLWDTRLGGSKPVGVLPHVHAIAAKLVLPSSRPKSASFLSPSGVRKRRRAPGSVTHSPRSVTCVEFVPGGHEIATAGAVDSVVKFWDLRKLGSVDAKVLASLPQQTPTREIDCTSRSASNRGISTLSFGHTGARMLVGVLNDAIKVVDVRLASSWSAKHRPRPDFECVGHLATSFYVKAAFSPDDDLIMSGSADGAVYVWDASVSGQRANQRLPCVAFKGHTSEVNGVAWNNRDFSSAASCSDDGTIRLWHLDRPEENDKRAHRARRRASSFSFALRASSTGGIWANWKEFLEQPNGAAYPVEPTAKNAVQGQQHCESMEAEAAETTGNVKSPMLIRRSGEWLRRRAKTPPPPASRRRSTPPQSQQTLFDCWQL